MAMSLDQLPSFPTLPPVVREPWEATWWVDFLQSLGEAFPGPDAPQNDWDHFMMRCSTWPFVLLALGFLAALCVLCSACCTCGGHRERRARRAPSCMPTFCLGLLCAVLVLCGLAVYWLTGSKALDMAQQEVGRAAGDVAKAAFEGSRMQELGASLNESLNAIPASCPAAIRPKVEQSLQATKQEVQYFNEQIASFQDLVQPLPGQVDDVKAKGADIAKITSVSLLVPLGLILLCCAAVLLAVMTSCTGSCTGCLLRSLAPLLLVPTVLAVTVAAAVQLETGIVTSSFCRAVDANAIAYIGKAAGQNSTIFEISDFYIEGKGRNPLLDDLAAARKQLEAMNSTIKDFGQQVETLCPAWTGLSKLNADVGDAQEALATGAELLSPANVYPYYNNAIRQDLCTTVVIGLAWLVVFQAAVGILLLPLLICCGMSYLKAQRGWHLDSARQPLTAPHAAPRRV